MVIKGQSTGQIQQAVGYFNGIDPSSDGRNTQHRACCAVFGIDKPIAVKCRRNAWDRCFGHDPVILTRYRAIESRANAREQVAAWIQVLRCIESLHIQVCSVCTQNGCARHIFAQKRSLSNIESDRWW